MHRRWTWTVAGKELGCGWLTIVGGTVALPWVWLASVLALWSVATARLGRAPRPLLDDPHTFRDWFAPMYHASVMLMVLCLPVLVGSVAAALVLAGAKRLPWPASAAWLVGLALSWFLALLVVFMNPGRVIAWYLD